MSRFIAPCVALLLTAITKGGAASSTLTSTLSVSAVITNECRVETAAVIPFVRNPSVMSRCSVDVRCTAENHTRVSVSQDNDPSTVVATIVF